MAIIARGQITIRVASDTYTIYQSIDKMAVSCDYTGKVLSSLALNSVISIRCGAMPITDFSIGAITKPIGFFSIAVNQATKTIAYSIMGNDTALADTGTVSIPIIINGETYTTSFNWFKVKAGKPGNNGEDASLLDWVSDWNSGKTVIDSQSVITPKIFAGTKNVNGTVTGIAIGKFPLSTRNASGVISLELLNGIYGFNDGKKTFEINSTGNVQFGNGNEFIKYNASTGKIEFGSEVSLNWVNAINTAKTETINSATAIAQTKADAAKNTAISAAATDATNKISALEIGSYNVLPNGDFSYYTVNNSIGWDNALNGNYVMSHWGSGYNSGVPVSSTGYHAHLNLTKFGFPVLELANKNSIINQTKRWLGISVPIYQKEKLIPGAIYTFSADLMADTPGAYIHGGVYSTKKGQMTPEFSSGQYTLLPNVINKWERVSYTFTLDTNADLTQPLTFYIYSRSGPEGICWVKNVSLQKGTKGSWVRCTADVAQDIANAKQTGTDAKNIADAITLKANTEGWSTKLTYIDSSGIFTGTLSANIVNALRINASQITTGVIDAARINVDALRSTLITTGNIEALNLNVIKGKIGGWNIDTNSIFRGIKMDTTEGYTSTSGAITIGTNGIRGFKWRLDSNGAGALAGGNISWNTSGIVTFAASVSLNWMNPIATITTALGGGSFPKLTYISSTGIYTGTLTATQVNAVEINASSIKTGTLSADRIVAGSLHANKLIARTITADKLVAGTITANEINVASIQASVVTATAVNGLTCTFAKGTIAGWNITASQIYKNNVYLGSDGSISNGIKWKLNNDGSGQLANGNISWNASGVVTFSSSVSLAWTNDATVKADAAKELASAMAFGRMLNRDPTFSKGDNGTNVYNNSGNGMVTIIRQQDANAPNDSKYVLLIRNKGTSSPFCGGFYFGTNTSYRKIFITRIIAKIPIGRSITFHTNSMGTGGSQKWLTPTLGTGDWCEYICKVVCGTSSFSTTHFFALTGNIGSESAPVDWMLSYATVFDVTSTEKYTTTIDSDGIYTASLNANQIKAGTISADRIAANSIHSSKLDANSIKANIINASYVNGLNCTFNQGTIGGWVIAANSISNSQLIMDNANKRIVVYGNGANSTSGHRVQLYFTNNSDFGFLATDAVGTNTVRFGSQNSIAGWTITSSYIYKNNIYLGSDGSIYNGTKWQLNNDGSGRIASGKIVWNAAGNITFDPSVSLLWTNVANKGRLFARGTGLNHNSNRLVYLNGNQIVSSSERGLTLTVIRRSDLYVISSVNYDVYGNDAMCNTLATALNALSSDYIVVLTSNDAISINSTLNTAIKRCGGSDLTVNSERIPYVLVGIPTIGKDNGLVAVYGTGATEPSAEISTVIFNGSPQGMNVFGKQKTYIDGNGIYTGTLNANQINAGIINTSRLDAESIRANIINTTYINGLSCTFTTGTIGGWYINANQIYKNSVALSSDGSIVNGTKWRLNNDGSGQLANGNIIWDTVGNVSLKAIVATSGKIAGFTISGNKLINTAADSSIEFSSLMGNAFMYINSSGNLLSLRADSARTGISIQTYASGARGMLIIANAGSTSAIESFGPHTFGQRGGERWCAPGVLYIGRKYSAGYNNYYYKVWGDGANVTSCSHLGDAQYRFYHNLGHTDYTVMAQIYGSTVYYGFFRLLDKANNYFTIQNVGSSGKPDQSAFEFTIFGRNNW